MIYKAPNSAAPFPLMKYETIRRINEISAKRAYPMEMPTEEKSTFFRIFEKFTIKKLKCRYRVTIW
jgi:hypothetical protein